MHALGIPTTRSLAVVATGEQGFRARTVPGAVARVAASHVRVGTFQFFAARGDLDAVRGLLDYVIARDYPDARDTSVPALAVLKAVVLRQAALIADCRLTRLAESTGQVSAFRELFVQFSDIDGWHRDWRERLASDASLIQHTPCRAYATASIPSAAPGAAALRPMDMAPIKPDSATLAIHLALE